MINSLRSSEPKTAEAAPQRLRSRSHVVCLTMHYVPYHKLGTSENIIVDGRGNAHTRLTLSHWPGSPTPGALKADTSAEIVLNYLDSAEFHITTEAVSNNHFDEDGLVGIWALLNPDAAQERRQFLLDVASAGDFGVCSDREAARVSFVLSAWTNPKLSPLAASVFKQPYTEQMMVLYEELLPRLINILDRVHYLEQYWKDQDELLDKSEEQLQSGEVIMEEHDDVDLCVVVLPDPETGSGVASAGSAGLAEREQRLSTAWDELIHPMAIHNSTESNRILLMQGQRYELYYRYESWVQYVSRAIPARVDLLPFAEQLNTNEENGRWQYDGNDDIVPHLRLSGALTSKIDRSSFTQQLVSYLEAHQNG